MKMAELLPLKLVMISINIGTFYFGFVIVLKFGELDSTGQNC